MSIKYIITEVKVSAVKAVYKVVKCLEGAGLKLVHKLENSEKRISVLKHEYEKLTEKQYKSEQRMLDTKEVVLQRHAAQVDNLSARIKEAQKVKYESLRKADSDYSKIRSALVSKKAKVEAKLS